MTMKSTLPYRFSKQSFDRFAIVISVALESWPLPTAVQGKPSGVMQPLRDAIQAKRRYGHTHHLLNERLWDLHNTVLCVFEKDGKAYLGPKPTRKLKEVAITHENLVEVSLQFLWQVCNLVNAKAFDPCPAFVCKKPHDDVLVAIRSQFHNIAMVADEINQDLYYII